MSARPRSRSPSPLAHLDQFLQMKGASALVGAGVFPNAKEITESIAAFNSLCTLLRQHHRMSALGDADAVAIVPGDGRTPKTAALLATATRWRCLAVDPSLRSRQWPFDRLQTLPEIATPDRIAQLSNETSLTVLVSVHSHAPFWPLYEAIPGPRIGLAIPCCFSVEPSRAPDLRTIDPAIASPKNEILAWVDLP